MQQNFQTLFKKEMSRKEFLTVMGFGIASIFGFSTIIKLLLGKSSSGVQRQSAGYGGKDYGDKKRLGL